MILSIVGGHDQDQLSSFLNSLVPKGGFREVRILDMNIPSVKMTIDQIALLHDFNQLSVVKMEELIVKEEESIQMLVFLTSSFATIEDCTPYSFLLVNTVVENISKSEITDLKVVFSDNYRGLVQQAIFEKLSLSKKMRVTLTTVSSVFQVSKILDSKIGDYQFRCYPKTDGTFYVYDPKDSMDTTTADQLSDELKDQISTMERVFNKNHSGSSYPCLEGVAVARFIEIYMQTSDWDTAIRDEGLIGRLPSPDEAQKYQLDPRIPVFLPPDEDGSDDDVGLPKLVLPHMKEASKFVGEMLKKGEGQALPDPAQEKS